VKLFFVLSVVQGVAVTVYGLITTHAGPSSVFLGLSAFALGMVLGLLIYSARALVEEGAADTVQATGRRKKELEREKQSLLKALKELEFDHEMGKISDADFADIGGGYRARAMRVLRQLDEQGADYKALVEKELKARLGAADAAKAEPAPAAKSDDRPAKPTRCASCGTTNDGDAVFCKKCGKKVAA
jgi:membrane protease subunit (stomatin/prohibitin family)